MRKVIQYMIISHTKRMNVVEDVNERIGLGWQPWGSLQVSETLNQPISFTQAMALYEPESPLPQRLQPVTKEEVRKTELHKPTTRTR